MIYAFTAHEGRLAPLESVTAANLSRDGLVWLDVSAPTPEETAAIERLFEITLGELDEHRDIEASARFIETPHGDLHLRTDFISDATGAPANAPVYFVVSAGTLISAHSVDLPVMRLVREAISGRPGTIDDAMDVLLEIYATDAEYSADALEAVHRQLRGASRSVLTHTVTDKLAAAVISRIATQEDVNGNVRHNIADTRRAVSFLMRDKLLTPEQMSTAGQIHRDLESLDAHTAFLFEKINFLMDATVGFVNINQNKVIKIFSVASVAMLPPTLIASIYGMNFGHMPELKWVYGYPLAIVLMVLSVAVPLLWFRQKKWLS